MYTYLAVLLPLVGLDAFWLGFVSKSFYQKHLGYIFAENFILWPAIIFYLLYAFGIMFFVVNPALESKSLLAAVYRGALLGLLAYGTYDLTNQATLAKWPIAITLADVAWGIVVTTLVSIIAFLIMKKI